jgi:hypothetical protein
MLTKHDRRRLAVIMVSVVWSVALLLPLPLIFAWRTEVHSKLLLCVEHWPDGGFEVTYKVILVTGVYIIPCVVVTVCHLDMGWSMRAEGKQKDPRLDLELTPLPPKRQADKVIIIGSHHPSLLPDGRYNLQTCPYQRYISYLTRLPFPHTEDPFISYLFIYTASQFSYVALY